jgi:purine-binding chemotaxis protein CheW
MSDEDQAHGGGKADAAEPPASPGGPAAVSLMLLRLGQRWFAMDARAIEEVTLRGPVTRVPMAPSHILGVTSLRGRLVTVVGLEQMLGGAGMLPVDNSATLPRLVVVRDGDFEMAVVAHGIHGLIERAESAAPVRPADAPDFVREEFDWQGGRVSLLDTSRLVAAAARRAGMSSPAEDAIP